MGRQSLTAHDEIALEIGMVQGMRQVLVDELAEITRLTNEHIAACDQQIAVLKAKREEARRDDARS